MEKIKIHNGQRQKKKYNRKVETDYVTTPPKEDYRRTTSYKTEKLASKYGYDYQQAEDSRIMVDLRDTFRGKAAMYFGGKHMSKKMTRFDKMKKKQELGFSLKENPLRLALKKADRFMKINLLAQAFASIKKN